MNDIPVGYQLHVTSWENDGDNFDTKILSGLTAEDVAVYVDLLSLLVSASAGGFANRNNIDIERVALAVREKLAAHPKLSDGIRKDFLECDMDSVRDPMGDLLGYSEYVDFRVFASCKVYLFETPAKDVTKQFVSKKEGK